MSAVQVRNLKNEEVSSLELPGKVFAYPAKPHLVYEAVCHFRAVGRAGTHATKNRVDVAGGGRKPYRQKKTGRARAGSIRSPLWRGGGTVHGPHPRDYGFNFPRKMRWNAVRSVLSEKVREGKLMVVDELKLDSHKTRDLGKTLKTLGLAEKKALLVDSQVLALSNAGCHLDLLTQLLVHTNKGSIDRISGDDLTIVDMNVAVIT